MALPQGINFRQNAGFVTDGANEDNEVYQNGGGTGNYPRTSAQGNTVGWESGSWSLATRDRNNGIDQRLAGIAFVTGALASYRVDLPSTGSYNIRSAAGDDSSGNEANLDLYDTTTKLATLSSGSPSAATFNDATAVNYSAANWPSSNSALTKTFSTTICRFRLNPGASVNPNVVAHIYIESGGGGGGSTQQMLMLLGVGS